MKTIVRMKFGSHLYGTDTPQSDIDIKSVFIPPARDIILQRVQNTIQTKRPKAMGEKNCAGEVDEEAFSLQRYLSLLMEGQTVTLDMLFAPPSAMLHSTPVWEEIASNRSKLLTRRSSAFVGYCRQQANKYGIKGSRVAAARDATELFCGLMDRHGTQSKLKDHEAEIETFVVAREHCSIVEIKAAHSDLMLKHFECCNRKVPWTVSVKAAHEIYKRLFDEYGTRALQAEQNEGVDWKALSHAVRVGREALELMIDGKITFPLPYREHILAIKQGRLPYAEVAAEIEQLLAKVEATESLFVLPEKADTAWIDRFVARHYMGAITSPADQPPRRMSYSDGEG